MTRLPSGVYRLVRRVHADKRGITGLETAIVLIAFIVVAAVFAFAVLTTGLFSSQKAKETGEAALSEAQSTLTAKGSIIARGNAAGTAVTSVEFKLTNAVGADPVALDNVNTLLSYSDATDQTSLRGNQSTTGDGISAVVHQWTRDWQVGAGDAVDAGEVVLIKVFLCEVSCANADPVLGANTTFTIELLPVQGAVIRIERTTPLEIKAVMDL